MADVETWHGTVTDRTVTFRSNRSTHKRWETVPISQIAGVAVSTERHVGIGIGLAVLGIAFAVANLSVGNVVVGLVGVAVGVAFYQGWPTIELQTTGADRLVSRGLPWKHADAVRFTGAVLERLHR